MKETFYFSHDYTPLNDPKLSALVGKYGAIGYGIFWRIVELLHQEKTHKLPHKEYIFISISKQMDVEIELLKDIINFAINECELFASDSNFFYSERVIRNIEIREDIKNKRSKAGKKSSELRNINKEEFKDVEQMPTHVEQMPTHVEQMPTHVEQNLTKERKGKESKIKESNINTFDFKKSCISFGFNEDLVSDWLLVRKNKKLSNTKTALKRFIKEVEKSGIDKNVVLEKCIYKSWGGFESVWLTSQDLIEEKAKEPIKQKPISKLLRKNFETNGSYLHEIKIRGEIPDPFDYSLPSKLTQSMSEDDALLMEADLRRANPNGLKNEL